MKSILLYPFSKFAKGRISLVRATLLSEFEYICSASFSVMTQGSPLRATCRLICSSIHNLSKVTVCQSASPYLPHISLHDNALTAE